MRSTHLQRKNALALSRRQIPAFHRLTRVAYVGVCTSNRRDHDRQDHLALPCYRQARRRWDGSCLRGPGRNSGPARSFEVSSPPELSSDAYALERVQREARAMTRFRETLYLRA